MSQWNLASLKKEAKKYKTRSSFSKHSGGAYNFARKNKFLSLVCSHMLTRAEASKKSQTKWTKIACTKEAKKYKTRFEFRKKSKGAYESARLNKWLNSICSHMESNKWSVSDLKKEAKKYKTRTAFFQNSSGAYCSAFDKGILDEVCNHMLSLKEVFALKEKKWNIKSLEKESLKYKTRSEFQSNATGAYAFARKYSLLEKICSHMESRDWDLSSCIKEAKKYKTRRELFDKAPGIYGWARRHNYLSKVCSHMPIYADQQRDEDDILKPKVIRLLKKEGFLVRVENHISHRSKPDIVAISPNRRVLIIELKADSKYHAKYKVKNQIAKYKVDGKKKYGNAYKETILVSLNGRYGISLKELESYLNNNPFKIKENS